MIVCAENGGIFNPYIQFNFPMPANLIETTDVFWSDVAALETKIADLKQHYQAIQADHAAWTELQARQQVMASRGQSLVVRQELKEIADLEHCLEERLLTILEKILEGHQLSANWYHLCQDLFWNAVRFGGVGVLIGWSLKTWLSGSF